MIGFMELPNKKIEKFINKMFDTKNAKVVYRDNMRLAFDVRLGVEHNTQIVLMCPSSFGPGSIISTDVNITMEQKKEFLRFLIKNKVSPLIDWLNDEDYIC